VAAGDGVGEGRVRSDEELDSPQDEGASKWMEATAVGLSVTAEAREKASNATRARRAINAEKARLTEHSIPESPEARALQDAEAEAAIKTMLSGSLSRNGGTDSDGGRLSARLRSQVKDAGGESSPNSGKNRTATNPIRKLDNSRATALKKKSAAQARIKGGRANPAERNETLQVDSGGSGGIEPELDWDSQPPPGSVSFPALPALVREEETSTPKSSEVVVKKGKAEENLRLLFNIMDRNGSGSISRSEMIHALRSDPHVRSYLGLPERFQQGSEGHSAFERIFQRFDENNSKENDWDEFS